MYEVNGDFGKVRQVQKPLGLYQIEVPFELMNAGWHCCNDKYGFHREKGLEDGDLFLFSVSNGGRLKIANNETIELPAASVAWIPLGCKHTYYTAVGELWELYWLQIPAAPWLKFEEIFCGKSWLPLSQMESICTQFEKMISWRNKSVQEFQIESSRAIADIYHLLMHEGCRQRMDKSKGDTLVQNILRDMDSACEKEWSLQQLSEQYFLSVSQLIRRFKAETGMTPHACLMSIRLQTAEKYLKYTGMSVDEISRKTGFSSVSNFIFQFRRYWGMAPQEYRSNC